MGDLLPDRWEGGDADAEDAKGDLQDFEKNAEPAGSCYVVFVDFEEGHETADAQDGTDGGATRTSATHP